MFYPYGYGFDSTFIILLPAILIAFYAQIRIKSTFNKYSEVRSLKGITAAQAARHLLNKAGLDDVPVEMVGGNLTDHYDPRTRVLRLSQSVYNSTSVAAIGVAAHEAGHAVQHDNSYWPLIFRNSLVPVANFGSNAAWLLVFLAFFTGYYGLIDIGIILFSAAVLFQIVTLPVEFNASSRAINLLESEGILYDDELVSARKVLSAAALTYIAAMLVSVAQLLRLIAIGRRRK
ncbi:putative neutral zinc metallopeptidase [Oxobacter pfennigii]|uniref:Putative neutral zinc metallopeptidase n=1 Tax=Oxobacter pfennigii TaxID=36849 RepID=A0A0P8W8B2_9CLOT|nr:zinc metallopeptidase [Oxobacter pfennigii]KPU43977.1 putative neutral zinc metallopeptidase [Oxobacter pfennigii]